MHKLYEIYSIITEFGGQYRLTPPKAFQINKDGDDRKVRAVNNSNKLIDDLIKYHVKYNNVDYDFVLKQYFDSKKSTIESMYNKKRFQLNVHDSNELQGILGLNNNQMRKLQKYVRSKTNALLLCNEKVLLEYQKMNELITAQTFLADFKVMTQYINSHGQLPMQNLPVYMVDVRDAISRLISNAFNIGTVQIHPVLNKNKITVEYGNDKSDSGCMSSVSPVIINKHHGKYGSLITTLTDKKVDETFSNYKQISKLMNNANIANQLLKRPNLIFISKTSNNDNNELNSKQILAFPL